MRNKQIWIRISFVLMLAVLITLPLDPSDVLARGGSPQDHGRRPSDDDVSIKKGELFGDLWLILRDVDADKDGAPIKCTWTWPESAYNTDGELEIKHGDVPSGYSCSADDDGFLQPYSFEQISNPLYDSEDPDTEESEFLSFESTIVDSYGNDITVYLIPLDDEGKVPDVYETLWGEKIVEADLGRYNVTRSTQYLLDAAFDEAIRSLAGGEIGLDPAGRLKSTSDDGSVKTVESPLQNIALYQKLMLNGFLTTTSELEFPDGLKYLNSVDDTGDTPEAEALDADDLLRAASFLGGGADKFCRLNVDMLVYVNTLLGVNEVVTESDDVGNETIYIKSYFDFPTDFKYDRFSVDREDARLLQPTDSDDTYMVKDPVVINGTTGEDSPIFVGNWDGADDYPIINFLRAADDALSVVFYTHNFQVPEEFPRVD